MKNIAFLLICLISHVSYCQGNNVEKNINLVVSIDNKIPFQGELQVRIEYNNGVKKDTTEVDYLPGNIAIDSSILNKMQSESIKEIFFLFRYMTVWRGETKTYEYKVGLKKSWLLNSFTVIRFYNMDNKDNRKIFYPIKGENYTYEVDTPNGSEIRVKKKSKMQ